MNFLSFFCRCRLQSFADPSPPDSASNPPWIAAAVDHLPVAVEKPFPLLELNDDCLSIVLDFNDNPHLYSTCRAIAKLALTRRSKACWIGSLSSSLHRELQFPPLDGRLAMLLKRKPPTALDDIIGLVSAMAYFQAKDAFSQAFVYGLFEHLHGSDFPLFKTREGFCLPRLNLLRLSLFKLFVFIALQCQNSRLLLRLFELFPGPSQKYIDSLANTVLCNPECRRFVINAAAKLFDQNFPVFENVFVEAGPSSMLKFLLIKALAGKNWEGREIEQLLSTLLGTARFLVLACLLDVDATETPQVANEYILRRNRETFEGLVGRIAKCHDRTAFNMLNDWLFGGVPVDCTKLFAAKKQVFSLFHIPLIKHAIKQQNYPLLTPLLKLFLTFPQARKLPMQANFLINAEFISTVKYYDRLFAILAGLEQKRRRVSDDDDDFVNVFESKSDSLYHLQSVFGSLEAIVAGGKSVPKACFILTLIVHFDNATIVGKLKSFCSVFRRLSRHRKTFILENVVKFRGQKDDFLDLIRELHSLFGDRILTLRHYYSIDCSRMSMANYLGLLDYVQRQRQGRGIATSNFHYTDAESLFVGCVKSPEYFYKFISSYRPPTAPPFLFEAFKTELFGFVHQCASIEEIFRLFTVIKVIRQDLDYSYCFGRLVELLMDYPVEYIYTLAPALQFWKSQDKLGFMASCPIEWQNAPANNGR